MTFLIIFHFQYSYEMVVFDDIESFCEGLDGLSSNYKLVFYSLQRLKGDNVSKSMIMKGEEYLNNEYMRVEKLKTIYNDFSSQISELCEDLMKKVDNIQTEDEHEVEEMKNGFENMKHEMNMKNEELKKKCLFNDKEPSFIYRGESLSKINTDLVVNYPGSYFYREYMDGERTKDGDIFIDCDGTNDELIIKYMKNDVSLIEDVKKMSLEGRNKLIDDLTFLELPIKKDVLSELCHNEDNEMMEAWRDRRVVMVNHENELDFNNQLKKYKLLNSIFDNEYLKDIHYDKQNHSFNINLNMDYCDVIADYLKNGKSINEELIANDDDSADYLINEMDMIGIELNDDDEEEIRGCFHPPLFMYISNIIDRRKYDGILQEWCGDYNWRLIFRASDNDYLAKSFHRCCDGRKPTLIVIKSSGGWIFGGYTTQSWRGRGIY